MNTTAFYNRFSLFYPLVDVFFLRQKRVLFQEVNEMPAGKLLEIGVGNGAHLHNYIKHSITGIDTSQAMLDNARRRNYSNVALQQMSGEELLFADNVFDYVVLSHVVAVVHSPASLMSEVQRVLKPGGRVFILNHFTPANPLKYIDWLFQPLSAIFHFRSCFYEGDLSVPRSVSLVKQVVLGYSYFKILIYQKL